MKLELSQSLQQQQILAPQMILSMDILLLPTLDLEQRIRQEFVENPALEIAEPQPEKEPEQPPNDASQGSDSGIFSRLEAFESQPSYYFSGTPRKGSSDASSAKHEALQNTEGRPPGLKESLIQQVHLKSLASGVREAAEEVINNLDHRGYLVCSEDELKVSMADVFDLRLIDEAIGVVRNLDPPGVGAENLRQCLLLQLQRDRQDYPLETAIIRDHLLDLGLNKIPKIAKDLGRTVDEIKDAIEIIASLDPIPGGRLEQEPTIYIRPDVYVEVDGDEISVRVESGSIPRLQISDSCRGILKESRGNREVTDFVRRKIESAQWLIQAIEQRQRTLQEIATCMVEYQRQFMLDGPEKLRAMKMQTVADLVGVHISTVSRAIKGKHVQTPWGLFELRYFFTGGVGNSEGEVESRRNVYRWIEEIIQNEDKRHPLSDSQIARELRGLGLQIARRTVTKYREQEGIPSSRLRKSY